MQYLDKRNSDGSILKITGVKLANKISIHCFEQTKKTEIYSILKIFFQNDYLEIFFKSFYFTEAVNIAHKITLNEWEIKNKSNYKLSKINISLFPVKEYLKDFLILNNIDFEDKLDINTIKQKTFKSYQYLRNFLKKMIFKIVKKKQVINNSNTKVAVAYNEGIDLDKRSDLFWFKDSKINPDDIILYFEYRSQLERHGRKRDLLEKIDKLGIKKINLWEHESESEVDFLNELVRKIKNSNFSNSENKSLKKITFELIKKFKYWYLFFKMMNIKIHMDAKDFGQDIIIKYLAMYKLGGCSLGKLRSHVEECLTDAPPPLNPCDIFFIPNKDSAKRLENYTINKFQYMITSGYPYKIFTKNNKNEIEKIGKFFSDNKKKFIILFLDGNYSENNSDYRQDIPRDSLYDFYNIFLNTLSKFEDVGIIIKNKRFSHLKNLKDMHNKVLDLQKKGICYIVDNPFQKMPPLYASIANLVVAVSTCYPSALMDCIQNKKKGIFYDLVNLKFIEKEWYQWGENKVIFRDAKKMLKKIIELKNGELNSKYFGNWSDQTNLLDLYQDNLGSYRIGSYLNFLLEGFNNKLSSSKAIINANSEFAKNWGKDKIIACK